MTPVLIYIALFLLVAFILLKILTRYLTGADLSAYDQPNHPLFSDKPASDAHFELEKMFTERDPAISKLPKAEFLKYMRNWMDELGVRTPVSASISPDTSAPVPGEWVIAPGADPKKRVFYIHGGAFMMGSPQSHRIITSKFSEITGAAVFAVDYRLQPEHPRLACLEDCQTAYRWLYENGPDGPGTASNMYIAGDSAGGNLTLAMLAWIRDNKLPTPTAAVALSPAADGTLSSPSVRNNLATDAMLNDIITQLLRIPRALLIIGVWISGKTKPCDPRLSPIHGDLSGLPPLLIHASDAECLADDSRRYAKKAQLAGSNVKLQLWPHMMHVWHCFEPEMPEAKEAFEQIQLFISETQQKADQANA